MKDILTVKELPAFQKPELYPVLDEFFRSYLVERDIEKTLAFVTEDVYSIGTGENEVAVGREQLEGLLRMEIEAMPEPIAYQILEYREKPEGEDAGTCFCQVRTTPESGGQMAGECHAHVGGQQVAGKRGVLPPALPVQAGGQVQRANPEASPGHYVWNDPRRCDWQIP